MDVSIYTRGISSARGIGAYAAILVCGDHRKELVGSVAGTSNNRMDILAAVEGLRALKSPCRVKVYSTNTYLVDAVEKSWISQWRANGWKNSERKPVAHADLWKILAELCSGHQVSFVWRKFDPTDRDYARSDALAHEAANPREAKKGEHL